jgi:subtilisin family serine protease
VRVLDDRGFGWDSWIIAGVDWVTERAGEYSWPSVANMSLGGNPSLAVDLAVCRAIAAGVTLAIAAGNSDKDACGVSPARVKQAYTVAATDDTDTRAHFSNWVSNWGNCVDVFAPGVDIPSAELNGDTVEMSGTSVAAPHVAGIAALCAVNGSDMQGCLVQNATADRVQDPGTGSPNRLLFTGGYLFFDNFESGDLSRWIEGDEE